MIITIIIIIITIIIIIMIMIINISIIISIFLLYFITCVFLTTLQHLFSKKITEYNTLQEKKRKIKKYYSTVCTYELETVGVLIQ